jgi:rare lipoprotein A
VKAVAGILISLLALTTVARAELVTYYGGRDGYCGKRTSSGERYNCNAMTAASRRYPIGSMVRACGPGGCTTVRINDHGGRGALDLSMAAVRVVCGSLRSCHANVGRR